MTDRADDARRRARHPATDAQENASRRGADAGGLHEALAEPAMKPTMKTTLKTARAEETEPARGRAAPFALQFGCLAFMGAIFFSTYGLANWLASRRAHVPTFAFGWERAIPFVPWSIVPYWSIDLLYVLSFFLCARRDDLRAHVRRLLTVQLISVACFIAWPLGFGFARPEAGGVPGALIALLLNFDKPYNQAPSLHIGLLVVLWAQYAQYAQRLRCPGARVAPVVPVGVRIALHLWFASIGLSVLTTWQHHVIDVPTGAAVGCLALFLFPLRRRDALYSAYSWDLRDGARDPLPPGSRAARDGGRVSIPPAHRSRALARRYALGALVALGVTLGCVPHAVGWALLAGWIALALACVASVYWRASPLAFQKDARGRFPLPMLLLFAPTVAGAFVNSRLWTFRRPRPAPVDARVSIGRAPTARELRRYGFTGVVDLAAEMPCWAAGTVVPAELVPGTQGLPVMASVSASALAAWVAPASDLVSASPLLASSASDLVSASSSRVSSASDLVSASSSRASSVSDLVSASSSRASSVSASASVSSSRASSASVSASVSLSLASSASVSVSVSSASTVSVPDPVFASAAPGASAPAPLSAPSSLAGPLASSSSAFSACAYAAVPMLDLVAPSPGQLQQAVAALERLHGEGRNVLVCCALGYGRSALCAAAWLALRHGLRDARDAFAVVRAAQPHAVETDDGLAVLQDWIDQRVAAGSMGAVRAAKTAGTV